MSRDEKLEVIARRALSFWSFHGPDIHWCIGCGAAVPTRREHHDHDCWIVELADLFPDEPLPWA